MNQQQVEKNLKKAIALHQMEKHSKAATIYKKVLAADAKNPSALHFYGLLHFHRGQRQEATELILAAIGADPNYLDAYINLGNVFLDAANFSDARKCYEKVLELDNSHIGAATNLGVLLKYQGEFTKSTALLKAVCESSPLWGQGYYNLANTQSLSGQKEVALESYLKAIELNPQITSAYGQIIRLSYLLNEPQKAQNALNQLKALDETSPFVPHMLAAFSGENVPPRASDAYVVKSFDSYAESFEASLAALDYKGPELLAAALRDVGLESASNQRVLDAGCGTGLSHEVLSPLSNKLIGMDLSSKMLKRARQKGSYDKLICASLETGIAEFENYFDLVVSMDTLIYFGDLEPVLTVIHHALKAGGVIIFTTEHTTRDCDYHLTQSGRYEHSDNYIENILTSVGFIEVSLKPVVVRREFNDDVNGALVTAKAT